MFKPNKIQIALIGAIVAIVASLNALCLYQTNGCYNLIDAIKFIF